jgi:hypothetical protein
MYDLDEALIGFGAALEARDFEGAAALLEPLALTAETGGWRWCGVVCRGSRWLLTTASRRRTKRGAVPLPAFR